MTLDRIALSQHTGIDLQSHLDRMPPGKVRRAFGVTFSREMGTMQLRNGQSRLNTTAITIWSATQGYTCSGDEKHIAVPSWRFTRVATDTAKSFCTQIWEVEHVEGKTTFSQGTTVGIFAFEEQDHGATNIPDSSIIHGLFRSQSARYQRIGTSLYKNFSEHYTGFGSTRSQFIAYRPLNETTIWTFIADDTAMKKTDGTNTFNWSIAAPTTAPTVAAGALTGLTGSYRVRYTYARMSDDAVFFESNPSTQSSAQSLSNQDLSITALVASDDPQVTHIRIYRTLTNGAIFFFDKSITNDTLSTTTSTADSALGSTLEFDNDPAPNADLAALFNEQILLDGDDDNPGYLWVSKRFIPWSFPPTSFLEMNSEDPGRAIVMSPNGIPIRFTRDTKYRILGTTIDNMLAVEAASRRGILLGKAWAASEPGIWFVATDGVYLTDGVNDQWMSRDIDPIFKGRTVDSHPPVNKSGNHVMEFFKNKLYVAYASGTSTEPDHLATFDLLTQGWTIEPMTVRALYGEHDTDLLTRGSTDGFVYEMEDEDATGDASAAISLDVLTGELNPENTAIYARYVQANVDADTQAETVTMTFLLDGSSHDSISLSAAERTIFREKLSSGSVGQRGQLRFVYSGTERVRLDDIELIINKMGAYDAMPQPVER